MNTQKDFIMAAKIVNDAFRNCKDSIEESSALAIQETFVKFFSMQNPRFNKDRFIEACRKGID
jgi:hypothetical protein